MESKEGEIMEIKLKPQKLIRQIKCEVKGDRQFIENEYIEKVGFITDEEINTLCDILGDDPEAAFCNGVSIDFDGEICNIDADAVLCWIEDKYEKEIEEDEDDRGQDFDVIMGLKKKLLEYRQFDIIL